MSALGMSRPRWRNIARYVHCDVLEFQGDWPSVRDDFDGVGLIWHRSLGHRAAHRADRTSQREMEADEARTFSEPVANCCLLAEEHVTLPVRSAPPATLKLFRFVSLANGRVDSSGSKAIVDQRRDSLADDDRILGHCVNLPLDPANEGSGRWGLGYDVVEEFWLAGPEALRDFLPRPDLGRLTFSGIGENSADCVVTNENVLYDLESLS